MKKLILLFTILFFAVVLNAQTDIIYPAEGGNIIFDCKINEVKNGNNVYYSKDSISDVVVAVAITKDGNYIDLSEYVKKLKNDMSLPEGSERAGLYKGNNYEFYKLQYKKSKSQVTAGIIFTVLGVGGILAGARIDSSNDSEQLARGFYIGGLVFVTFGVPVWISGSIKAANNKRAMELTKSTTHLSFGTTNNGVGLVLNF
jgi:hypothetical protein